MSFSRFWSMLPATLIATTPYALSAQEQPSPAPTAAPLVPVVPLPPVAPTRAQENVVRQAEDGFGSTIGRESIGIYSAGNVRGFSALSAGNARINGLFFDQVAAPSARVRRSTAIRVALSALTFPFPAPTGVVDYTLARPVEAGISAAVSADSYKNGSLELDFSLPVFGEQIVLGGGAALLQNDYVNGSTSRQTSFGVTALIRPTPDVEVQPFWTRTDTYNNKLGPAYAPAGNFLPPDVRRRRFFGQDWTRFDGGALLYGIVAKARIGDGWTVDGGVFRSAFVTLRDTFVLLDDITPEGTGRYLVFTDPTGKTASNSGEVRITKVFSEGPRTHRLIASLRGRDRKQLSGGSDVRDFGPVAIGEAPVFEEPDVFNFTEQNLDRVRQFTGGIAYAMRWAGKAELSGGLSKTDYVKRVRRPGVPEAESKASPFLYYGNVAFNPIYDIVLYAGYTRGLEESGVAPQNAINRNEALPAILTSQRDAGLRWSINDRLKLVAGVFDVRKPYFSRDAGGLFTQLGNVRNRGIEMSVSGMVTDRLRTVIGAVLLDPKVTGEGVVLGRVGKRPVGLPKRKVDLNIEWTPPVRDVSLNLRVTHQSGRPATTLNQVFLPDRTLVDLGGRYKLRLANNDATLRITLSNLFDKRGFDLFGSGTYDIIDGRKVSAYLAMDF